MCQGVGCQKLLILLRFCNGLPFWILKNCIEVTPDQSSFMHSGKAGICPKADGREAREMGASALCVLPPAKGSGTAHRGEASLGFPLCCVKL